MIKEIFSLSMTNSSCGMKFEKKQEIDIDFDRIVKFLNDQKAAMEYAGLN